MSIKMLCALFFLFGAAITICVLSKPTVRNHQKVQIDLHFFDAYI